MKWTNAMKARQARKIRASWRKRRTITNGNSSTPFEKAIQAELRITEIKAKFYAAKAENLRLLGTAQEPS